LVLEPGRAEPAPAAWVNKTVRPSIYFASAVAELVRYRGDGTLRGWIWSIVLNAARGERRGSGRRRSVEASLPEAAVGSDGSRSDFDALRRRVAALPERQRLAVFLRYYADLEYRAIAEILGIETGTVSATLSAAHAALRPEVEEALK
jgi:RNA polymerase sigma factor (sigma-70 family)